MAKYEVEIPDLKGRGEDDVGVELQQLIYTRLGLVNSVGRESWLTRLLGSIFHSGGELRAGRVDGEAMRSVFDEPIGVAQNDAKKGQPVTIELNPIPLTMDAGEAKRLADRLKEDMSNRAGPGLTPEAMEDLRRRTEEAMRVPPHLLVDKGPIATYQERMNRYRLEEWIRNRGLMGETTVTQRGQMSADRVRFFLPDRYFQTFNSSNGFRREKMKIALYKAFDLSDAECDRLMRENPHGFHIICRPSQFGRFIVARCGLNEGINGVKDLEPEVFVPRPPLEVIAGRLDVGEQLVRNVLREAREAGVIDGWTEDPSRSVSGNWRQVDVSTRPNRWRS